MISFWQNQLATLHYIRNVVKITFSHKRHKKLPMFPVIISSNKMQYAKSS